VVNLMMAVLGLAQVLTSKLKINLTIMSRSST